MSPTTEDTMSLDDLRAKAERGEVLKVTAAYLLALVEDRNRLEDAVVELRAQLHAKKSVPDGASP